MEYDYRLWQEKHSKCVSAVERLCELDKKKNYIKCNSLLCVMKNAMLDIHSYFEREIESSAELCFLIRNLDVMITGILDLNNLLFGIGLNKIEKAIERCFANKDVICHFRTLRSLILAHPVDTHYKNNRGEIETVFLEDIRPFNPRFDGIFIKQKCEYVKRLCKPESHQSYFEPLSIDSDIIPVIHTVINSLELLIKNTNYQITMIESRLSRQALALDKRSISNYILSLDKELKTRYPSAVEDIVNEDESIRHYSIVYQCLLFFSVHFARETQEKYDTFLDYVVGELRKIESDLLQMSFNEDRYFTMLFNPHFASELSYEKSKMEYLKNSDGKSFTIDTIEQDTLSDALWGVRCFRLLVAEIQKYLPVDVTVSDKGLYCQYIAAVYLSNVAQ